MSKARALVATAAAALALLAGACSSDPDTPPSTAPTDPTVADEVDDLPDQGTTPDPCALLTLEEVSAAIGETFTVSTELQESGLPGQRTCSYEVGADSGGMVSVGVWPFQADRIESFKAQSGDVTEIAGIGEAAWGEPRSAWAFDGTYMVNVLLLLVDVESIDPITSLTRAAVDRLP